MERSLQSMEKTLRAIKSALMRLPEGVTSPMVKWVTSIYESTLLTGALDSQVSQAELAYSGGTYYV